MSKKRKRKLTPPRKYKRKGKGLQVYDNYIFKLAIITILYILYINIFVNK